MLPHIYIIPYPLPEASAIRRIIISKVRVSRENRIDLQIFKF
jgi:hypothetical protein